MSLWIIFGMLLLIASFIYVSCHYTWWRLPHSYKTPRILMYHSVGTDTPSGMHMPVKKLETHLHFLHKNGFSFWTVSELITTKPLPSKSIALTLDDGFADNYAYLFPLLQKYQAKATIYLAPNINNIIPLTPAQIQEMQASGLVEFGAHTMHHINLLQSDDYTAKIEIQQSKQAVETLTGQRCSSFAYPFGRFTTKHVEMVKNTGFTSAVTTKKRIIPLSSDHYFTLPRLSMNGNMNNLQWRILLSRGRYRV